MHDHIACQPRDDVSLTVLGVMCYKSKVGYYILQ